jgi:broad specificity phosphatase PhoE
MRNTLILLRHTQRAKPGQHLNQRGINLAHALEPRLPNIDVAFTSSVPRAIETAIALGVAVTDTFDEMAQMGPDVLNDEDYARHDTLMSLCRHFTDGPPAARAYAAAQAQHVRALLARAGDEARVLIVTHGGIIEAQWAGLAPETLVRATGAPFDVCEGLILRVTDAQIHFIRLLRNVA